jgi:hypothetical protein
MTFAATVATMALTLSEPATVAPSLNHVPDSHAVRGDERIRADERQRVLARDGERGVSRATVAGELDRGRDEGVPEESGDPRVERPDREGVGDRFPVTLL